MWNWIYTTGIILVLLTSGCDFVEDRIEEHQPRDWKHYCTVENPDSKLCWAGEKAPWVGGPFCHNIPRVGDQAPGTAVRCKTNDKERNNS